MSPMSEDALKLTLEAMKKAQADTEAQVTFLQSRLEAFMADRQEKELRNWKAGVAIIGSFAITLFGIIAYAIGVKDLLK